MSSTSVASDFEAAYHHLYEYGNIPFFIVHREGEEGAGRRRRRRSSSVRDVVNIRYTFDERITDGFYTSTALERFREYIENPELLEGTPP